MTPSRTVSEPLDARETETGIEISREGVIAAKTLVALLVVTGVVIVAASWNELWRSCGGLVVSTCVNRAATAALISMFSIAAIGGAIVLGWRLRGRPVDPEGSSRYVIVLGVLFALGLLSVAGSIPAWTCPRGRWDEFLEMCLRGQTRSDATSWLLLKRAIVLVGLVGGVAIAFSRRWARVSAPLAVLGWFAGVGGFLVTTKMIHLA
jgi:hypothetical protein